MTLCCRDYFGYGLNLQHLVTCDQASLFLRREGTPDTITQLFVCHPLCRRCHQIRMNQSELPEVALYTRHEEREVACTLLYSTAEQF